MPVERPYFQSKFLTIDNIISTKVVNFPYIWHLVFFVFDTPKLCEYFVPLQPALLLALILKCWYFQNRSLNFHQWYIIYPANAYLCLILVICCVICHCQRCIGLWHFAFAYKTHRVLPSKQLQPAQIWLGVQ